MQYFCLLMFLLRNSTLYNMMLNFAIIFLDICQTDIPDYCLVFSSYFKTMCAYRIEQTQGEFQFLSSFLLFSWYLFFFFKRAFWTAKAKDLLSISLWPSYLCANVCVAHTESWHTSCEVPAWCGVSGHRVPPRSTNHGFAVSPSSSHNWKIRVRLS